MTRTEDSYGMDGKVSQSNITSDTSWQGLEELSGASNIDEYRSNPRLSLEDWTNYLRAVYRAFALLNSHPDPNKANGTRDVSQEILSSQAWVLGLPASQAQQPASWESEELP